MILEEKELLLKDLSTRLPYEVKIKILGLDCIENLDSIGKFKNRNELSINGGYYVEMIRPYLRPMSSMTEEERKEFNEYTFEVVSFFGQAIEAGQLTDWLSAHHFDYRGLIEKGLALEAKEEMYNETNTEKI